MNRTMAAQSPDCADGAWSGSLQGRARREAISRAWWNICGHFFDQSKTKTLTMHDAFNMCLAFVVSQIGIHFYFDCILLSYGVLPRHLSSSPSLGDCIYPPRYLAVAQSAFVWVQSPSSVNTLICRPVTRCHCVTWSHCTSASKSSIRRFVITEKAPTRAFSWLKAATTNRFHI